MFLGRYQLGQDVNLFVVCTDSNGYVINPDEVPRVLIYNGSGSPVANGRMPVLEPSATKGFFTSKLFLSESFTPGIHTAIITWVDNSYTGGKTVRFEIVAGGSGTGQIQAMTNYERIPNSFIVNQRQSGYIYRGKNPVN